MIVTDDEEMYHILLSLRAHGCTRSLPKKIMSVDTRAKIPLKSHLILF